MKEGTSVFCLNRVRHRSTLRGSYQSMNSAIRTGSLDRSVSLIFTSVYKTHRGPTNINIMKVQRAAAFFLSSIVTVRGVGGLPFRGRNANNENEEGEAVVSDRGGMDGTPISIQIRDSDRSQSQNRNAIVELFYENPNDRGASEDLKHEIRNSTAKLQSFLTQTRRTLHRHPELMYQERFTSQTIQEELTAMGIEFSTGWAKNIHPHAFQGAAGGFGFVVDIGTGQEPCLILRADMDALPIQERTEGVDAFVSQFPNTMHACGHDGHTTMLLGAARLLKSMEASLPGTVRLMFQPAEEGGAGGKRMREEGVLQKHPAPSYAFGLHVWPTLPSGTVATRPGPLMAACERFEVLVHGVGGHAASECTNLY